jgi:hypothetical protein
VIGSAPGAFRGCEIGCLATPVDARPPVPDDSRRLARRIERQFGVCEALQRTAEAIFEDIPTLRRASNFVVRFVEALPEGVDVRASHVRAWGESKDYYVEPEDGSVRGGEEMERKFLSWLRAGCPAPKVPA